MNDTTEVIHAEFQAYTPTWRDKIRRRLFPYRHCQLPDAPSNYADCITIHTEVVLSWTDRIRAMLSGRFEVTTKTVTENVVGKNITASECYPLPPRIFTKGNQDG